MVRRRSTLFRLLPATPDRSAASGVATLLPGLLLGAAVLLGAPAGRPALAAAPAGGGASSGSQAGTSQEAEPAAQEEAFTPSTSQQIRLADHLSRLGFLFYGAWWCPACTQQKSFFGQQAVEKLPYVECERSEAGRQRCNQARIRAYPTWVKGGERREGVLTLEELQSWSGFRPSARSAAPLR